MTDIERAMRELAEKTRSASVALSAASPAVKRAAILRVAELLTEGEAAILADNAKDVEQAKASGMTGAKLDRLTLTPGILESMREGCRFVADLSDPVGEIEGMIQRQNGLLVGRMRMPLGVVGFIYESRPNVTIDAAVLCLKAGNAVILRGGSEALRSNLALAKVLGQALAESGLPAEAVAVVPTSDREAVNVLLKLDEFIDVVIPRGGEGLIRAVTQAATMPVLKHYKGVCHIYVDECADLDAALPIVRNAKVQRPGVCNALECLLVHKDVADLFLPRLAKHLPEVELRADARAKAILDAAGVPAKAAGPSDFGFEFCDLILAVAVVDHMEAAMEHIRKHGSHHTEVILTNDHAKAMDFLRRVDASMVGINCSTRFNDGGELGLGAEIGISTTKMHAYGPMGVKELTCAKFVVLGKGQIRG